MSVIQPEQKISKVTVDDVVNKVKHINGYLYYIIKQKHTEAFDLIWNNKNFTPKEIVDAFGTDAVALFILSGTLQDILKRANAEYEVLLPKVPFNINNDGTITLIEYK